MSKTMDRLNKQLTTENNQDAKDCILIYTSILSLTGGVNEHHFNTLVKTYFIDKGNYTYIRMYKPTEIGKIFLKGLNIS